MRMISHVKICMGLISDRAELQPEFQMFILLIINAFATDKVIMNMDVMESWFISFIPIYKQRA